jgi:hypothetical protein
MTISATLKEFRDAKPFTGLELAELVRKHDLQDYVLHMMEKVYDNQNGLAYMNPYTYVVVFRKMD